MITAIRFLKNVIKTAAGRGRLLTKDKLINGDYQTAQSKSDYNIVTSIKFFTNNLPSFQQYKDQDELDWLVKIIDY